MFVVKSEMLLLTTKIEVKNEETYLNATGCVVVDTANWLYGTMFARIYYTSLRRQQ